MRNFYEENQNLLTNDIGKNHRVILTPVDSQILIGNLRKDSFAEIVQQKLKGHPPDTTKTTYFLTISLIFYGMTVGLALYFIK